MVFQLDHKIPVVELKDFVKAAIKLPQAKTPGNI